ncbi:peptidase M28-like protein [Algoriphagus ratkowskyi]|uniref:Carboxypeptidase Q n=1 Tax=Algoriphagus ratkowskyi TaxID=57028 RepID=A0A2W7RX65_9BACT|nr:M20/M25/M40 family metallo-hydrolase [Algoriphagus ratkowskyi]PZX59179.1 peptidase M28-like protein [Algoriphagus ratkowskyi]TXD77538.1 M20/M25/M40 family metallo-hydrolase [Algoriphagus ratkowskyi]
MKRKLLLLPALFLAGMTFAQVVELDAIEKIKKEGLENSHVEELAFQLVDKAGPRLSNSEGYERAVEYTLKQLTDWGLKNAAAEPWGEFGRGWEMEKSYVAMTKPYYMPFIAIPKAWTESTKGEVSGKVVFLDIKTEKDFAKYKGKLKGAIVAIKPSGTQEPTFAPDAVRFTEEELQRMAAPASRESRANNGNTDRMSEIRAARALSQKISEFIIAEGPALIIKGVNGRHGTLFTSSPRGYIKDTPEGIPELETAPENVNLMARLSENGVEVEIEAEVKTRFRNDDLQGYNVIAEIPGSDPTLKSEIVMLGGHLDSWHGANGATDNAAGCIVMMEAVRILQATGLQPKRTVRIALWGGEEQGLHGSRGYVNNHFGDRETMKMLPEHEKMSAYYNIDNGTGRIRGIYLQGNEAVGPIFNEWFAPLDDIVEDRTITIDNTGGTDHQSFDALGLPGFQFIQDPIEYRTRTHHTNMDTYERLEMDDLKQMAVVVASFVYSTAQKDEMLPRKKLKK